MRKRRYPKGWNALDEAWRAIEAVPFEKTLIRFAHRKYAVRNQAIRRYLATGEPGELDQI